MKKLLLLACLMVPALSFAESDTAIESDWRMVDYNEIDFSATAVEGGVEMEWSAYEGDGFEWYKVMRSNIEQDPVYPDQEAIAVKGESELSFFDENPLSKAYYRVCAITTSKARSCSNVVWVESEVVVDTTVDKTVERPNQAAIKERIAKAKDLRETKTTEKKAQMSEKKEAMQTTRDAKKVEMQEKKEVKKSDRKDQRFEKLEAWSKKIYTRLSALDISNEQKVSRVKRVQEKLYTWGEGNERRQEMVEFLDLRFQEWIQEWESGSDLESINDLLEGLLDD